MSFRAFGRCGAVAIGIAMAASGCYYGPGFAADPNGTPVSGVSDPNNPYPPTPAVQSAWLEGTMGSVTADRGVGASGTATIDTGLEGLRIDMENTSARWWAMASVEFSRTLDLRTVPIGTVITQDPGYYSGSQTIPEIVHARGCSGPSHGDWNFDEQSGNVSVRVEAGSRPDTRTLVLTADFGTNTVHGAVELQVP